jgi:hypothetical protein
MPLLNSPTIPTELLVVGEDRNDPRYLLLLGDDGLYYSWFLLDDDAEPVELDQRWLLTAPPPEKLQIHQS